MNIIKDLFCSTSTAEEFKLIADKSSSIIWVADKNGLYTWLNKSWLNYTGRSFIQEEGKGWAEGLHNDDVYVYTEEFKQKIKTNEPFLIEYRIRRHDGVYRWFLSSATPIFDNQKKFIGYKGVCFDITQRKESENYLSMTAIAFEAQHGIIITDKNQTILCVNTAFTNQIGYTSDEIIDQKPHKF